MRCGGGCARRHDTLLEAKRWRNAFCDRQMFWAHDHNCRGVFVTSDDNFQKRLGRPGAFRSAQIATPDEALALLSVSDTTANGLQAGHL